MSSVTQAKAVVEAISNICVIVVAGILIWTVTLRPVPAVAGANNQLQVVDETIAAEFVGNRIGSAKLTLVEFADFECPFCARHATNTFPRLKGELIDRGRVEFDTAKRYELFDEAMSRIDAEAGFVPLVYRHVTWAMRKNIKARLRPNDILDLRFVNID